MLIFDLCWIVNYSLSFGDGSLVNEWAEFEGNVVSVFLDLDYLLIGLVLWFKYYDPESDEVNYSFYF